MNNPSYSTFGTAARLLEQVALLEQSHQEDLRNHPEVPCLMGAQDMWRWKGADDTPAPCRCEGCKQLGRIVINH